MRVARLSQIGKPLVLQEVQTPVPQTNQVLVKVEACGVCHTDVELRRGSIGGIKNEAIGMRIPVTLGHEIAGMVQEVGEGVEGLSKGDRVLLDWVSGDGVCDSCKAGDEVMCNRVRFLGIHIDGGYAESVVVPHWRHVFKFDSLPATDAAPFADAGFTAFSATKKAEIDGGSTVVVVGTGGVGLMAIQFASKVYGAHVISVGRRNEVMEAASKAGALHVINSSRTDAPKEVMKITGGKGVDAVLDLVCADSTLKMFPPLLAKRGRYVMVGLFGGTLALGAPLLTLRNLSFMGSDYGNRNHFREMLDFAGKGIVRPVTTSILKLDQINEALDRLEREATIGRQVVTP